MKILIVIDSISEAKSTLDFASQILRRSGEPPTILTVLADSKVDLISQAENYLASALDSLGVQDARTQVRTGEPIEEITQEAIEGDYDLVIIGEIHPQGLFERLVSGSIAIKVAESAPCSVIVVRGKASLVHRILLCDSGAGLSSLLSRLVVQLSNLLEGEEDVTVLHVMSQISAGPGVRGGQLRADAQELVEEHTPEGEILERDLQILDKPRIHPSPKVRHGLVVDEILAEARSGDYDLVVVGAHPSNSTQSYLLDNIAHQIIKQINRPILIVRDKEVRDKEVSNPIQ